MAALINSNKTNAVLVNNGVVFDSVPPRHLPFRYIYKGGPRASPYVFCGRPVVDVGQP